jgi:predicted secreted protein
MGVLEIIVVFTIIWWVVFLATLPWGVRPPDQPGLGHAASAPERPRLWLKALIATAITAALTGVVYWIAVEDLITFSDL